MYTTLVRSGDLREDDLPSTYAEWVDYARFAASYRPRSSDGRWRFHERVPDSGTMRYCAALVRAMRQLL